MPPVSQPANNPIKQISAGTRHSLAVAESGHAYSWGLGRKSPSQTRDLSFHRCVKLIVRTMRVGSRAKQVQCRNTDGPEECCKLTNTAVG